MGGDPADGDLVSTLEDPVARVHRREGVALARTEHISSHPLDGCGEVDEEGVATPALLAAVDKAEYLVDGEYLRVEYLLVRAEVVATPGPATR